MNEPFCTLGISSTASPAEIKRAYYQKSLKHHPDKGGNEEDMKRINKAYKILTDEAEREKHQAQHTDDDELSPADFLNFSGERSSETYRRWLQEMCNLFAEQPLNKIVLEKRQEAFAELNMPFLKGVLSREYYKNLYCVAEDGIVCEDIFQYVAQKKWSTPPIDLPTSFFNEPLTFEKGTKILINFLEGTYYGKNLEAIKNYVRFQIRILEDVTFDVAFYKALETIISGANLVDEHVKILGAIDQIYSYIYQTYATEKAVTIELIQSKHFRYFVACTLKYDWQNEAFAGPKSILLEMKSDFTYLRYLSPMSRVHLAMEEKIQQLFSKTPSVEEVYECAYILIDLMFSSLSSAAYTNSAFMAALCFHYVSTVETEAFKVMAAEGVALQLYQTALLFGFNATAIITSYISTQVIKCLGDLKYDQTTISIEDIKKYCMQSGDFALLSSSGCTTDTLNKSIKKALYFCDMFPFVSRPKSILDIEIIEIFQIGMLRTSLSQTLSQTPSEISANFNHANLLYIAYELTLQGNWRKEKEQLQNRNYAGLITRNWQ